MKAHIFVTKLTYSFLRVVHIQFIHSFASGGRLLSAMFISISDFLGLQVDYLSLDEALYLYHRFNHVLLCTLYSFGLSRVVIVFIKCNFVPDFLSSEICEKAVDCT